MKASVVVNGAYVDAESVDGVVTIAVDTYEELRALRLTVNGESVLDKQVRPD